MLNIHNVARLVCSYVLVVLTNFTYLAITFEPDEFFELCFLPRTAVMLLNIFIIPIERAHIFIHVRACVRSPAHACHW